MIDTITPKGRTVLPVIDRCAICPSVRKCAEFGECVDNFEWQNREREEPRQKSDAAEQFDDDCRERARDMRSVR